MKRIKFQGKEYLLIHGAICTPEQFRSFAPSYAALNSSTGDVMRFGKKIGTKDEIEVIEENPTVEHPTMDTVMEALDEIVAGGLEAFKNREAK